MDCAPPPPSLGAGGVPKISRLNLEETREVQLQRVFENKLPSLEQVVRELIEPLAPELMQVDASTQYTHEQYKLLREELYPKYIELLEETLEILLAESGSSVDEVYELAKKADERGQSWPCTEFLAAAEDFHSFLALVQSSIKVITR